MKTELEVLIACYQTCPHPEGLQGFRSICNIAPDGARPEGFREYDDLGFPRRNRSYGELSALRTAQNSLGSSPYLGLAHYRRVFATRPRGIERTTGQFSPAYFSWASPDQFGADAASLARILDDSSWVTPVPMNTLRSFSANSVGEQFLRHHPRDVLEIASIATRRVNPTLGDFAEYLFTSQDLIPFNMFLTCVGLLESYLEFLWPTLEECIARIGELSDPYQDRYAGFVAERLHGFWLDRHAKPAGVIHRTLPILALHASDIVDSNGKRTTNATRRHRIESSRLISAPVNLARRGYRRVREI